MWRWLRKLGNVTSPIWVMAQGLPKVEDSVSAVTTAGATVLPYALIFGTLLFRRVTDMVGGQTRSILLERRA